MARLCKHDVDLTQYNCEMCAREFSSAHPEDRKPFPTDPPFRVYHNGNEWQCDLANYTGTGKTIGRAIDAAITTGLGFGRSLSLKRWIQDHHYTIAAISMTPDDTEEAS